MSKPAWLNNIFSAFSVVTASSSVFSRLTMRMASRQATYSWLLAFSLSRLTRASRNLWNKNNTYYFITLKHIRNDKKTDIYISMSIAAMYSAPILKTILYTSNRLDRLDLGHYIASLVPRAAKYWLTIAQWISHFKELSFHDKVQNRKTRFWGQLKPIFSVW